MDDLIFYGQLNKLARSITKWTKACDKRLNRLISYIFITQVNTNNIVMWEILLGNADLGLFQDSDFAGDLEDSKSTDSVPSNVQSASLKLYCMFLRTMKL